MRNRDVYDAYGHYSSELGAKARALSLYGIAAVWVFSVDGSSGPTLPRDLLLPGGLFVLSLALDLFQVAFGAFAWGAVARFQERRGAGATDEFIIPTWLNWPANAMFYGKFASVVIGYSFLLIVLYQRFVDSAA